MRRVIRALTVAAFLAAGLMVATAYWVRGQLRGSLPTLNGSVRVEGLSAPVTISRDVLGIPTIGGTTRSDVARATGFVHAQDRFFQMDLARRRAAGELAALVGGRALAADRQIRIHRFRSQARRALERMDPAWRAVLDAYTAGVNAGLASMTAPPFEYLVLGGRPQPWRTEDSLLVVLSMFITLQDPDGAYEATLGTMHDVLPAPMAAFMAPLGTEWDSPILGPAFAVPPIPGPDVYDLRARRAGKPAPPSREVPLQNVPIERAAWDAAADREGALGSNNWAVAGSQTADGAALLANDMHLTVRVPNTWYRALLEWQDGAVRRRLVGITLPGVPALVVGSNTQVAWGFTNSQGDWSDIVVVEVDPDNPSRYRAADGWHEFARLEETIEVAGEAPVRETVTWTIWGPLMPPDHRGRLRAFRWVAHDAQRLAASPLPLERAATIEEAFDAVNGLGTPGQNFVAADASGRIGWTIFGSMPRRVGFDGRVPASWADGARGWHGWLDRTEYPRVVDPESGRIWTANARVVDGAMLAALGDGNYEVGSRARIIRDRLAANVRFTARDFLDIQLDASATFLTRWRDLLLQTLADDDAPGGARAQMRDLVERDWDGRASPASAGYRLVRLFREAASELVLSFALVECAEADPTFDFRTLRRREGPVWALVTERPMHLLDPRFSGWDVLLLRAADDAIARAEAEGGLAEPWQRSNVTTYRHPLSAALPFVGRLLDMPIESRPGDLYTPNMHWNASAPSERMIVSPGREDEGIMHMPTGQSGHPLSLFYANSHPAWLRGDPTPLLPGPTLHRLELTP